MSTPNNAAVLVVDDVPENRDLLVRRLKRLGINEVEQAANGIEALAAIERRNFDLVLLDIMMPELDGFGVLERLKANGRVNDLPTARSTPKSNGAVPIYPSFFQGQLDDRYLK